MVTLIRCPAPIIGTPKDNKGHTKPKSKVIQKSAFVIVDEFARAF